MTCLFVKFSPSRVLLAGCAVAFSPLVLAAQPLMTDDTGTQGAGGNQLEFSYTENRGEVASNLADPACTPLPNPLVAPCRGVSTKSKAMPLVYTRGITDTIDVFVQANEGGTGNPSFGGKWRFFENEDSKTSIAIKPEVRLPINRVGETQGQEKTTYALTGIISQEVPFGTVHANLFHSQDTYKDWQKRGQIGGAGPIVNFPLINLPTTITQRFSIAPMWEVSEEFKLVAEAGIQQAKPANAAATTTQIAEIGVIYSPNKNIDVAGGVTRNVDNATPSTTTYVGTVGVTWRFK